jgi:hypothetical protein
MWCLQACFLVAVWESIDMWKDPWIPWLDGFIPIHRDPSSTNYPQLVSSLIDSSNKTWKIDLLLELVDSTSKEAILKITIPSAPRSDNLIWTLESIGNFFVKSTIKLNHIQRVPTQQDPNWQAL